MRVKKDRPSARDVPHIFSNQCIEKLVAETGLPLDPGRLPGFATSIRTRALIYIRDKGTPSDADVAREVAELYWAADRHQHAKATKLVRNMSKRTRDFLKKRATMPSVALTIPKPSAFLDSARRQAACETLRRICSRGGAWDDNGRWVPLLLMPTRPITRNLVEETKKENTIRTHMGLAPIKIARPPKRQAARDFIMWMQAMYLSAGRGRRLPRASMSRPPTTERYSPVVRSFGSCSAASICWGPRRPTLPARLTSCGSRRKRWRHVKTSKNQTIRSTSNCGYCAKS
jgi:hypothetical protein